MEILGEAYYDPVGTMIVEDNEIYRSPSSLHSGIHGVLIGGSEVTATISGNTFVRTESGVVSSTGGPLTLTNNIFYQDEFHVAVPVGGQISCNVSLR